MELARRPREEADRRAYAAISGILPPKAERFAPPPKAELICRIGAARRAPPPVRARRAAPIFPARRPQPGPHPGLA